MFSLACRRASRELSFSTRNQSLLQPSFGKVPAREELHTRYEAEFLSASSLSASCAIRAVPGTVGRDRGAWAPASAGRGAARSSERAGTRFGSGRRRGPRADLAICSTTRRGVRSSFATCGHARRRASAALCRLCPERPTTLAPRFVSIPGR